MSTMATWSIRCLTRSPVRSSLCSSLMAYDQDGVYATVAERHPEAAVIVPPRNAAVPSGMAVIAPKQRDRHLQCVAEKGRMASA